MKKIFFALAMAFFAQMACRPSLPDEIPLPTKICVRTQHHTLPIPNATVYVKFNTDSFPGYNQPASYFDAVFKTGADARGCLAPVPEGRHWMIAYGYDSLYFPHDVYGSMRAEISVSTKPVLDTIMYVSE